MKTMTRFLSFILLTLLLSGCAGYRFVEKTNPLSRYGIKRLCVPMFYNYSTLPHLAALFTREVWLELNEYTELHIQKDPKGADACLIGIIQSEHKYRETLQESSPPRVADDVLEGAIGDDRPNFYVPSATRVELRVQFVMLKNPSIDKIKFFQSTAGQRVENSEDVHFNEVVFVSRSFNHSLLDGEATSVNYTQNQGFLRETLQEMARDAAQNFKELMIYAF